MSLKITDNAGKHHEYLWLNLKFIKVIEAIRHHYPEAKLFCVGCGNYHHLNDMNIKTAKEFKHRVEIAQEDCKRWEQEVQDGIARDIARSNRKG